MTLTSDYTMIRSCRYTLLTINILWSWTYSSDLGYRIVRLCIGRISVNVLLRCNTGNWGNESLLQDKNKHISWNKRSDKRHTFISVNIFSFASASFWVTIWIFKQETNLVPTQPDVCPFLWCVCPLKRSYPRSRASRTERKNPGGRAPFCTCFCDYCQKWKWLVAVVWGPLRAVEGRVIQTWPLS